MNTLDKSRVLVIGLDGGTLDLIGPWGRQGHLPAFAHLINKGASGPLRSTIPTISPAAWTSFMTGKNPGKHGVFDFIRRRPDSYQLEYVQTDLSSMGTMFRWLSQQGRRVGVIGVPMTYPPEPINGFMVAGSWAPENECCAYPSELAQFLWEQGYTINNAMAYTPDTARAFAQYVEEVTEVRASVALELLRREPWDLFMAAFRDVDTLQAFYWHDMDPAHPFHTPERAERFGDVILDHHRQLDRFVSQMLDEVGDDATVVVMSDHGGGPLYHEIFINNWLLEKRLLALKRRSDVGDLYRKTLRRLGINRSTVIKLLGWPLANRLKRIFPSWVEHMVPWPHTGLIDQIDWSRTKAYSFGSIGQIYINVRGREPQGIVEPGQEYEEVVAHIVEELGKLADPETGTPISPRVFRREEIYWGPYADKGPDLNVVFGNMSCISHITLDAVQDRVLAPPADYETGTHRMDGMVVMRGPHVQRGAVPQSAQIIDLAPTILYLMGEPIPTDMDGRVLTEMLIPDFVSAHPIRWADRDVPGISISGWTLEEEARMVQHLKGLGYLG